ncbi:MAG: flavodoxin [Bacillota bacterium]|nr:flavodoxin [Bacillota bacterium]
MNEKKALVAYFSCSGVTKSLAERLAATAKADIFEIRPSQPYSQEDLDWRDPQSRSSLEMKDPYCRPVLATHCERIAEYDYIFVGFPIWWYVAPRIIDAFLESHDLSGKTIIPFATSGGSGLGESENILHKLCPETVSWRPAKLLPGSASPAALSAWLDILAL